MEKEAHKKNYIISPHIVLQDQDHLPSAYRHTNVLLLFTGGECHVNERKELIIHK